MKIKRLLFYYAFAPLLVSAGITGCAQSGGYEGIPERVPFDPAKTIVFSDFSPKEGSVRTLVFIDGQNFGTDLSRIKVYIGGEPAPVIGSDGNTIVAMVPRRANEGSVRVEMLNVDDTVFLEYEFEDKISIAISTQVGTLTGKVDPATGQSSRIDGTLEEAEFQAPWWLELTRNNLGQKVLLVHDGISTGNFGHFQSLREINLETEMVRTLFTQGQAGIYQGLSIAMDPAKDTLFAINDNGNANWNDRYAMPAIYYAIRSEDFQKPRPYQYGQCCYSAVWFTDGTFYYNTYLNGMLLKGRGVFNEEYGMWDGEELFSTWGGANRSGHQYMIKHPNEDYIYVTGNTNGVRKVPYDKTAHTLINSVTLVAGDQNWGAGYAPGTGSTARFNYTRQGVFVKNEDYVKDGKPELYDFYFCDQLNHCIWKLTPEGTATLFAGRGSQGLQTSYNGMIDGEAIKDAQFYQPTGIAYDEDTGIFYIADRLNRRIRTLADE